MRVQTLDAARGALAHFCNSDTEDVEVIADGRVVTGLRIEGYLPDDRVTLELLTDAGPTESKRPVDDPLELLTPEEMRVLRDLLREQRPQGDRSDAIGVNLLIRLDEHLQNLA